MTRHAITPRLLDTAPGQLGAMTVAVMVVLYLFAPFSRDLLSGTAPLLLAMVPATIAGSSLRLSVDTIMGERFTIRPNQWWQLLVIALTFGMLAFMTLNVGKHAAALADSPLASFQVMLATFVASGLALAAFGAGVAYGDDATWRRERGLE